MNTKVTVCVFACLFAFVIGQEQTCMTSGDCKVLHCEVTGATSICVQGICICVIRSDATCTAKAECDDLPDFCRHQKFVHCYEGHCICVYIFETGKKR